MKRYVLSRNNIDPKLYDKLRRVSLLDPDRFYVSTNAISANATPKEIAEFYSAAGVELPEDFVSKKLMKLSPPKPGGQGPAPQLRKSYNKTPKVVSPKPPKVDLPKTDLPDLPSESSTMVISDQAVINTTEGPITLEAGMAIIVRSE